MPGTTTARQNETAVSTGLTLAAAVIGVFFVLQIAAVFAYRWSNWSLVTAPLLAASINWLYVGLFIVAHDCMHGSLAPGHPRINRAVGQFCVALYAGFDFADLREKHFLHHRYSGTADDPDFDPQTPQAFWSWYWRFMGRYMSSRQPLFFTILIVLCTVLGADAANIAAFIVAPALASTLQLFYFGTYLPHRPSAEPFIDEHRARSSNFDWLLSLLTCFHFGYHHEHHVSPGTPWWRLPGIHAAAISKRR